MTLEFACTLVASATLAAKALDFQRGQKRKISTAGSAGSVWSSTRRRFATTRSMPTCFVISPMSTCAKSAYRSARGSSCSGPLLRSAVNRRPFLRR